MKKIFILILMLFMIVLPAFADGLNNKEKEYAESLLENPGQLESTPFKVAAELSVLNKKYKDAIGQYYVSYLRGEIKRNTAYVEVNSCREKIDFEYIPLYYGITKLEELPNVVVAQKEIENYDVFVVIIKNNSNQKIILNGAMTKGIAINSNSSQVEALGILDARTEDIPYKFYENMLSNNKVYPGASFNFIYLFPKNEGYKGLHIDSIYYEDHSKEEIYIDFFNYE